MRQFVHFCSLYIIQFSATSYPTVQYIVFIHQRRTPRAATSNTAMWDFERLYDTEWDIERLYGRAHLCGTFSDPTECN